MVEYVVFSKIRENYKAQYNTLKVNFFKQQNITLLLV